MTFSSLFPTQWIRWKGRIEAIQATWILTFREMLNPSNQETIHNMWIIHAQITHEDRQRDIDSASYYTVYTERPDLAFDSTDQVFNLTDIGRKGPEEWI